jgi:glucose-1-phosphate thymidylyltransferase
MIQTNRKGIILAGGAGTRLQPSTNVISKQLLPIYDKPMIYYALSTLMLSGIREILIISTPHHLPQYEQLLGNGKTLGIQLQYEVQDTPGGLAEALVIGKDFIQNKPCALILGDNFFYGNDIGPILRSASSTEVGAKVFIHKVKDARRYGVADFDDKGHIRRIIEKPSNPPSAFAVTGLYFYDSDASDIASSLKPSDRGELEITDVNNVYLQNNNLTFEILGRGCTWMDVGTPDSLLAAGNFISLIQNQQDVSIGCIEEIAFNNGWITRNDLASIIKKCPDNSYRSYLTSIQA